MNSFTEENYIKAIYHLSVKDEGFVSTNAIADSIKTKAATVTDMIKRLAEKGIVNYIKYQGVSLTEEGQKTAINIIRKHRLWEVFLVDKLNFKWDEVHDIAEELEHINSAELVERLDMFLNFPKFDPHGDPIPDKNGKFNIPDLKILGKMTTGDSGLVSGVNEHSAPFLQHLERLGLTLGKHVEILEVIEYDGSVMLRVDKQQQQIISRDVAKNIFIAV